MGHLRKLRNLKSLFDENPIQTVKEIARTLNINPKIIHLPWIAVEKAKNDEREITLKNSFSKKFCVHKRIFRRTCSDSIHVF